MSGEGKSKESEVVFLLVESLKKKCTGVSGNLLVIYVVSFCEVFPAMCIEGEWKFHFYSHPKFVHFR